MSSTYGRMPTNSQPHLIVFGCGSQALYVIDALAAAALQAPVALVDLEAGSMVGQSMGGISIRWSLDEAMRQIEQPNHVAVMAHGDNRLKLDIAGRLEQRGIRFASARHPRAGVSPQARVEPGCILCPGCEILPGVEIEAHAIVHAGAVVDHDCRIGRGANIAPGASLAGRVKIGDGAYVYTGASIAPKVTIGPWAIVGAGAVVLHDVAAGEVVVGNPTRKLRSNNLS